MGLHVKTLATLPAAAQRKYYMYLLDYGWKEPLAAALEENFKRMAALAEENDTVVIGGISKEHFVDEVLSWHHVNGEDAEGILPAILITNRHPAAFRDRDECTPVEPGMKMILVPLRKFCKTTTEVVTLVEKLFKDIKAGKDLKDFAIEKEVKRGNGLAVVDAITLRPNFMGLGIDFNKIINHLFK